MSQEQDIAPKITLERRGAFKDIKPKILEEGKSKKILMNFNVSLIQIKSKFDIVQNLESSGFIEAADNILRAQIVLVMSCLDFYMHEIVKYCIQDIFQGKRKRTSYYENFVIALPYVEKAIKNPESIDWLEEGIIVSNKYNTYMSIKKIEKAISLISTDKKILDNVANDMGMNKSTLKERLENIYGRRNSIAHQMDRDSKTGEMFEIKIDDVKEYVNLIESFVEKLHGEIVNDI